MDTNEGEEMMTKNSNRVYITVLVTRKFDFISGVYNIFPYKTVSSNP